MATRAKVAARRNKVAQLYLRGWSQVDIAKEFGVTQGRISQDLKEIQKEWAEQTAFDLDAYKAEELARIKHLEQEYWHGWQRSLKDAEQSAIKAVGGANKLQRMERVQQKKGQTGDARFLDGVGKCIERRCKLLGIDAPQKHDLQARPLLTDEERRRRLINFLKQDGMVEKVLGRGGIDALRSHVLQARLKQA